MKLYYNLESTILNVELEGENRFEEDVLSHDSESYKLVSIGYFLNTAECLRKYHCNNLAELIINLYQQEIPVSSVLNGAYIIVIFEKNTGKLQVFNDLLSKRSIYYSFDENTRQLFLSDHFFGTLSLLKANNQPYTIDELGVKMMIKHQVFYDNITYVNEIRFLRPFEYIMINGTECCIDEIQREDVLDVTLDEAAQRMHGLFKKAVTLQYQKNEKNGYPQVATISGGMDSRSTFLYSLQCGFTSQKCYNYAESGSDDFHIAEELSRKYNCEFYYHSLGNGNFLKNRDKLCTANEAQMAYDGTTGTLDSLEFYNSRDFAIIHTGLGGGEIMGDICSSEQPTRKEELINSLRYKFGKGKSDYGWTDFFASLDCTEKEADRIRAFKEKYRDFNEFQNLNDMRRCLSSQKIALSFGCHYVSPFLYEEFFCYMLRIPYELKKGRQLYLYWQKKYNPMQFETKSTFMLGVTNVYHYYIKRIWIYLLSRFGRKSRHEMNPLQYWKKTNPTIEANQKELYSNDMRLLESALSKDLYNYINDCWTNGRSAKENILTATWALAKLRRNI